jgi:hypothetical protein
MEQESRRGICCATYMARFFLVAHFWRPAVLCRQGYVVTRASAARRQDPHAVQRGGFSKPQVDPGRA